jgi:hypothetical protein
MKSWKSRLLMVFTMLAVVLVITVPAMAEDIHLDVECEADGGHCAKQVSYEVWHEDTVDEGSDAECFPFCEEDVSEDPTDEGSDEGAVDEESDADTVDGGFDTECFPFCEDPLPF